MNSNDLVYLEIKSLIGISIGAIHFYGTLVGGHEEQYQSIDLERILTKEGAIELTKQHGIEYIYEKGDITLSFNTKDDIRSLAIATYKNHFPNAKVLILGQYARAEPQLILDAPEDFKRFVNDLVKDFELLNWEKHYSIKDRICRDYFDYLEDY